jgi:mannitol-1-phosphate/altronate dehydrogenase
VRWLPALREARRRGLPAPHLVTVLAAWLRLPAGRGEGRRELPFDDPLAARLRAAAAPVAHDPAALVRNVLAIDEVFGPDLRQDTDLTNQLTAALTRITQVGVRDALPS